MTLITSRANAKIKLARSLRQRKARQESGLFLVEGIRHVGEAVDAGASLQAIYFAPDLLHSEYASSLVEAQSQKGVECLALSTEAFASLADKENPQGILAVVRQPAYQMRDLTAMDFPWVVALVDPQDPGNLGTILRTIDAVGASALLLLDSQLDAFHPSAVRASMGSLFWHPIVSASFSEFSEWARKQEYTIYGTSAHGSLDYRLVDKYQTPRVLLLGSERQGLSREQAAACDVLLRLPMLGKSTSLNLAVAAGVMLYAMLEQRAGL